MKTEISKIGEFPILLRAHHLFCSVLFLGSGYSKDFVRNMTEVVETLKQGSPVQLKTLPDAICGHCPNQQIDGSCSLDKKQIGIEAESLDRRVLDFFDFEEGKTYPSKFLYSKIEEDLKKEDFEGFCKTCRWFQAGYCNYALYKKRLALFHHKKSYHL